MAPFGILVSERKGGGWHRQRIPLWLSSVVRPWLGGGVVRAATTWYKASDSWMLKGMKEDETHVTTLEEEEEGVGNAFTGH